MSSEEPSSTRSLILEAAFGLLDNGTAPSMSEIASRAGVSRQALYLHFESRAALLLATVDFAREKFGVQDAAQRVASAPNAKAALAVLLEVHLVFTPRIMNASRAIEAVRAQDPEFDAAWQTREEGRRRLVTAVVDRFVAEGWTPAPGWSRSEASDWLASLLAPPFAANLLAYGWTWEQMGERTGAAALTLLTGPPG